MDNAALPVSPCKVLLSSGATPAVGFHSCIPRFSRCLCDNLEGLFKVRFVRQNFARFGSRRGLPVLDRNRDYRIVIAEQRVNLRRLSCAGDDPYVVIEFRGASTPRMAATVFSLIAAASLTPSSKRRSTRHWPGELDFKRRLAILGEFAHLTSIRRASPSQYSSLVFVDRRD